MKIETHVLQIWYKIKTRITFTAKLDEWNFKLYLLLSEQVKRGPGIFVQDSTGLLEYCELQTPHTGNKYLFLELEDPHSHQWSHQIWFDFKSKKIKPQNWIIYNR